MGIQLADFFAAGQEGRQAARSDQARKSLASYMQSGDQGALASAYTNDPQAAMQAQRFTGMQKQDADQEFVKLSSVYAQSKDPATYAGWRQAGIAAGRLPPETPPALTDPADLEGSLKTAQAWAGGGQAEQFTLAPGSTRYDASGRVIAEQPFAPQKPEYQLYDGADGPAWLPKPTGAPQPSQMGGGAGALFDDAYQDVLKREGGFVANDAGAGPTNFGINSRANPDLNVASLTPDSARSIYKERYWDAIDADRLPPQIREAAFDTAVNMGPEKAKELVQQSGGDPQRFAALRQQHYDRLAQQNPGKYGQYAEGWRNRNMQTAGLNAIPVAGVRPKVKASEKFETMSAQEVAALGLPTGTIAQRSPNGQVQIINKPRDLPSGGQVVDNGDGTTTYIPAGKVSEGERNAAGFYGRMARTDGILNELEKSGYHPTNAIDRAAISVSDDGGVMGAYARSKISDDGQKYHQAAMDWVRAKLRKESGAAIGKDEAQKEYENYFPVYGDSAAVIEQKRAARAQANAAMRQGAGAALAPTAPKQPAPAAGGWSIQRVD